MLEVGGIQEDALQSIVNLALYGNLLSLYMFIYSHVYKIYMYSKKTVLVRKI